MNSNLIERETLGQFADTLIAQKYPNLPDKAKLEIREKVIDEIDERIGMAIFGSLTEDQLEEINAMLDRKSTSEKAYREFFARHNVNLRSKIDEALADFKEEYLGGENA